MASPHRQRRPEDDIVAVRIEWPETDLRERAKRLGGVWRSAQRVWELPWGAVRTLGIAERVVEDNAASHHPG